MSKPKSPRKRPYGHGSITLDPTRGYVANYRDLRTGAQRRQPFKTEDEAHVFLNNWFAEKAQQKLAGSRGQQQRPTQLRRPGSMLFETAITAWRAEKIGVVRDTTFRNYDPALNRLKRYLGTVPLDDLTPNDFVLYRTAVFKGRDPQTSKHVKPLSPATVNQHLDRAEQVLDWAIARRHRTNRENPASKALAERLRVEKFQPVVVDEEPIAKLLRAAKPEHRFAFIAMSHLALRVNEVLALSFDGFVADEDGPILRVTQQLIEDRSDHYRPKIVSYLKSSKGRRELRPSATLLDEILVQAVRLRDRPNPHNLIYPSFDGVPRRYRNWLRDVWKPTVEAARLDHLGLTPHGLRHSRLSLMARAGVNPGNLSRFAGHENVLFTMSRYADHFSSAGIDPATYLPPGVA